MFKCGGYFDDDVGARVDCFNKTREPPRGDWLGKRYSLFFFHLVTIIDMFVYLSQHLHSWVLCECICSLLKILHFLKCTLLDSPSIIKIYSTNTNQHYTYSYSPEINRTWFPRSHRLSRSHSSLEGEEEGRRQRRLSGVHLGRGAGPYPGPSRLCPRPCVLQAGGCFDGDPVHLQGLAAARGQPCSACRQSPDEQQGGGWQCEPATCLGGAVGQVRDEGKSDQEQA